MLDSRKKLEIRIEELKAGDWPRVLAIYLEGISTGHATFETSAPPWAQWDAAHLPLPGSWRLPPISIERPGGQRSPGFPPDLPIVAWRKLVFMWPLNSEEWELAGNYSKA